MKFDSRPIGVFDSGLGGLTVLRELISYFPQETFIYLGDTARLPYGSKSPQTIRKYSEQTISHLLKYDVKALVIACNSASSQFLEENEVSGRPLYNVIQPGSCLAAATTQTQSIGILGTRATIQSRAYHDSIKKLRPEVEVHSVACPLFVPLAEEGWDETDPLTNLIVYRYLQPLLQKNIDTVVLGCTHYPLLKKSIQKGLGQQVQLIDSGRAIAALIEADILKNRLHQAQAPSQHKLKVLATDTNEHFQWQAHRFLEPSIIDHFEIVTL